MLITGEGVLIIGVAMLMSQGLIRAYKNGSARGRGGGERTIRCVGKRDRRGCVNNKKTMC